MGYTLSKINTNLGKQFAGVNSRLSGLKDYSNQIAGNTFKTQLELSDVNDKLDQALTYIRETPGRIEGTNLSLSRMEADFDLANAQLKKLLIVWVLLVVQVVPFLLLIYLQSKVM